MNVPIKIGVIDSGVDVGFLKNHNIVIGKSANFDLDVKTKILAICEYDDKDITQLWRKESNIEVNDKSGHGTEVLSIIYKEIKDFFPFTFHIAKVLKESNSCNSICLIEALRWMINSVTPDVINLSLSSCYNKNTKILYELTKLAKQKNIEIFCSATGFKTYPAEFNTVITVGDKGLFKYRKELTKVDRTVDVQYIEVYKSTGWMTENMLTSYACPYYLSNYLKDKIKRLL